MRTNIDIDDKEQHKNKSFKGSSRYGVNVGLIFFFCSILMGISMTLPITIASILESLSMHLSFFSSLSVGVTVFYISSIGVVIPVIYYVRGVLKKSASLNIRLVVLFFSIIIFLNTALFYKDWLQSNFKMDGQQAFGLIFMPFKTCWIYLIIGVYHDSIKEKK